MKVSIISDQIYEDLDRAFSMMQKEGYRFVELHNVWGHSIEACTKEEINQMQILLEKYQLQVSNLASTVFFLCPLYPEDQVSLFNPHFYSIEGSLDTHLQALDNVCQIACKLHCLSVRIFPFRWPDNRKGPYGTKKDMDMILENIKQAVLIAQKYKVVLVLENCPYSHLPKGEMTLQIVQAIQSPYLKLLWDPANSYRAIVDNVPKEYTRWNLEEELENLYPYIGHIHIKDYCYDPSQIKPFVHVPLGKGDIPYPRFISILKKKGYTGSLSLEPEVDVKGSLESMRVLKDMVLV